MKDTQDYFAGTYRLIKLCILRTETRSEPLYSSDDITECNEEMNALETKAGGFTTEINAAYSCLRKYEDEHPDLGIHILQARSGRQFDKEEYILLWALFWSSFVDTINAYGKDLISAGSDSPDSMVNNRHLLYSTGLLRASGIVVKRPKRKMALMLLEREYCVSESSIRILADGHEADITSFEAEVIDRELYDLECVEMI